ncbi:rhodanese-related sulfurtransferase [bacterium]|jgi:rhodanese-related sulfurtransferase|nr:rhodanese-related sulfurtransferase [bacterium]
MPNPYNAPEISVGELAKTRQDRPGEWLIVDVRESFEISLASLEGDDVVQVPLSELSQRGLAAWPADHGDKTRPLAILCHHGIRSAQVTLWLMQQGWEHVRSVAGGIDQYAQEIDPNVGAYE